ncbi:uncharacterized protein LOC134727849 [Mytilus trossulus]|uniref:uncharacterized protein LOC134727849 n=1 Tax=Mytilus trossulus TaxID=6551 RepID=UPI0030050E5E
MDADIRAEVHNAVQNTQEKLLDNMTTLLESRLDGFQRRIQENQKSLSDTQIAKIDEKMSDTYKFRKRGKSYFNAFKRWERFISLHGHVALPAQPVHVALYLTDLVNNGSTYHAVYHAIYGIKWAHEINSLKDPTTNTCVTSILEASKRVAPKKTNKKDPVTTDVLIELCDNFKDCSDLLVLRDLTMMLLWFAGFLRNDELSSLRFLDIDIQDSFLILHITKSKTDQYRQINEVIIAKGSTIACPYNMLVKYTRLAGLHSFRSGGATVVANADVSDRCLKKHDRWKTDSSKDGYIVDSIERCTI